MPYAKIFGSWEADHAWRQANCLQCSRTWSKPTDKGCDIEDHLIMAFFDEGDIPKIIEIQMGYDGTVTFRCKEFTRDSDKSG